MLHLNAVFTFEFRVECMVTWNFRQLVEVESKVIRIVSRDGLIKMKSIAHRLEDLADIEALERIQ